MDMLILGDVKTGRSQTYRGTDRITPYYCDDLSEEHKANQLFLWYCNEGGEQGVVHDLARAKEIVDTYSNLDPPQHFEVVEVTMNHHASDTKEGFLGFDLSASYGYSLLSWNLEIEREVQNTLPEHDPVWLIKPLLRLTKDYFQPRLNANGLFNDYHTASFCLECMMALQKIRPGLWENEDVRFEIIGLSRVYSISI